MFNQYSNEQNEKFGFLQALMDKIRKHAESMGLKGDMQVHVVEVKPLYGGNKENNFDETASVGYQNDQLILKLISHVSVRTKSC